MRSFDASGGTYGSPRVHVELRERGWRVSKNTVATLMAELGLAGRVRKRRRSLTRQGKRPVAPDLVKRKFTAPAPDVAWYGDMTEIVTAEGKLYLATVIDLHSRLLLDYAMDAHHDTELVLAALHMAAATRGGDVPGVVFHTDRGSEYTPKTFGNACGRLGVVQSMGRVGSALDNAVTEATYSTLKVEYIHRRCFTTRAEARIKIATWITDWYNPHRRHSACDWLSPIDYENPPRCEGMDTSARSTTSPAVRSWTGSTTAATAGRTRPHPLLITQKTAVELGPAGKLWITRAPRNLTAALERLRVDRQLKEALTHGADPLHLALAFGIDEKTAIGYVGSARQLRQAGFEADPACLP
ncbi:IS3 family transposase [Streptomyces noursei]|uniref:IS3 family transposase n=1 Tax=Streptomyces noursei TaxID=1971 RepID=UPI0033E632F7